MFSKETLNPKWNFDSLEMTRVWAMERPSATSRPFSFKLFGTSEKPPILGRKVIQQVKKTKAN